MTRLISSKEFIGELMEDLNLDVADHIDSIYRWIEYAVAQAGILRAYPLTNKVIDVEQGQCSLPCNIKFFHSLWTRSSICTNGIGYINIVDTPFVANPELMGYQPNGNMGRIEDNILFTDLKEGKVLLIYRYLPKDSEGFPMIVDNAFLREALNFYIIYRFWMKGIKHNVISFETAMQKWEQLYPRAANDIDWFTLPELESFTRMWSTLLAGTTVDNLYIY